MFQPGRRVKALSATNSETSHNSCNNCDIARASIRMGFEKCGARARYVADARTTNGFIVKINIRAASRRARRPARAPPRLKLRAHLYANIEPL